MGCNGLLHALRAWGGGDVGEPKSTPLGDGARGETSLSKRLILDFVLRRRYSHCGQIVLMLLVAHILTLFTTGCDASIVAGTSSITVTVGTTVFLFDAHGHCQGLWA
jgi:hypothetical protein